MCESEVRSRLSGARWMTDEDPRCRSPSNMCVNIKSPDLD